MVNFIRIRTRGYGRHFFSLVFFLCLSRVENQFQEPKPAAPALFCLQVLPLLEFCPQPDTEAGGPELELFEPQAELAGGWLTGEGACCVCC